MPTFVQCIALAAMALCNRAHAVSVPLSQGGEATFVVEIRNTTQDSVASAAFATLRDPFAQNQYTLEVVDSALCVLQDSTIAGILNALELRAGPVAAQSSVRCTIHVTRSPTSHRALWLGFGSRADVPAGVVLSDPVWQIGPLMNLSISAAQLRPFPAIGERGGIVRISIHNDGPLDVDHADFGYCQDMMFAPFVLDNALPGGCLTADIGASCFAVGGPSVEFGMGTLPVGETQSCLLRATALEPLSAPVGFMLDIFSTGTSSLGELPADTDSTDDRTSLMLAPQSSVATGNVPVPSDGATTLVALAAGLILIAVRRSSRHLRARR